MSKETKDECEARWVDYGKKHLVGRTIKQVRYLTEEECEDLNWYSRPIIIQLSDGTMVFPSSDDEGNNAGALFGQDVSGNDLTFPVLY